MLGYYKNFMNKLIFFTLPTLLTGCVNVEPWERNYLAKDNMAIEPYPLAAALKEHIYYAREGTDSKAISSAGGNCGCN